MHLYMEVRMTKNRRMGQDVRKHFASIRIPRGLGPLVAVVALLVLVAACSSQPSGSERSTSDRASISERAAQFGLDLTHGEPRTSAAAMGSGKHQAESELDLLVGGSEPKSSHSSNRQPGPDDWRIITNSLRLFQHAPYVTDLVLGLVCSIFVALVLTATPKRSVRFDPVAQSQQRKATVICAMIGCIAAELVQSSEQFLMGAEIALVLFGIGGLVRFRTIFNDAGQTGVAIVATILGLACGMSEYSLAALSLTVVFLANWWMSSIASIEVRVRIRKNGDISQVQAAVTAILQEQHFSVLRATPNAAERRLDVYAQTGTDFDSEALSSAIQTAVPGARVKIRAS